MKSLRMAAILAGLLTAGAISAFFLARPLLQGTTLSAREITEAFSPAMDRKQISETLRGLGVTNFTHRITLGPGYRSAEDIRQEISGNYDIFTTAELARTASVVSFDQAVGSEILSFSTKYMRGTFLLDPDEKLIAFSVYPYNEGL